MRSYIDDMYVRRVRHATHASWITYTAGIVVLRLITYDVDVLAGLPDGFGVMYVFSSRRVG